MATSAWAQDPPAPEAEPLRQAQFDPSQTYYVHVPRACAQQQPCPLFVAVHGAMASGKGDFNLWKPYADQEGFILLAPNFPGDYQLLHNREDQALIRIINELTEQHPIDRSKILLSGFSNGAKYVFGVAMHHRALAHTMVLLNTGNLPEPPPATVPGRPKFFLTVGGDEAEYAAQLPAYVEALKQAGYRAEGLVAPGVGHSIPSRAIGEVLRLVRSMKSGA